MQLANNKVQQSPTQLKASTIKNKYLMVGALYTTHDTLQWRLRWTNELFVMGEARINNIVADLYRFC